MSSSPLVNNPNVIEIGTEVFDIPERFELITDCEYTDPKRVQPLLFNQVSTNGIFSLDNQLFYKAQIDDSTDSIVSEAIHLKLINTAEQHASNKLFPQLLDAFTVNTTIQCNNKNEIRELTGVFRFIVTNALENTISLHEHIHQVISAIWYLPQQESYEAYYMIYYKLEDFMNRYYELAKRLQLSHNDLHLGNILVDTKTGEWKVIDCGRAYIKSIENSDMFKYDRSVADLMQKLCVHRTLSHFVNYFHITGKYNYISDLMTVALNTLVQLSYFNWPEWCIYELNARQFTVNYMMLYQLSKRGVLVKSTINIALAWFVCCLMSYEVWAHYYNLDQVATNKQKIEHIRLNMTPFISKIDILYQENNILLSNSVLNPIFYIHYKNFAEELFALLKIEDVSFNNYTGGSTHQVTFDETFCNQFHTFFGSPRSFKDLERRINIIQKNKNKSTQSLLNKVIKKYKKK